MNVPIINHPDYVAQIGDDHRFPIKKFGELIKLLKNKNIAKDTNIYEPTEVSIPTLLNVLKNKKITFLTLLRVYLSLKRSYLAFNSWFRR